MRYRIDISWHNIDNIADGSSSLGDNEINGKLSETLNDIDYFDFSIYYGSSNWAHIEPNLTYVKLWDELQNRYIFYGRVLSVNDELRNDSIIGKQIHCESEIAYLCDSACDVNDVLLNMKTYYPNASQSDTNVYADKFIYALLTFHAYTTNRDARCIYPPDSTWNSGGYFDIGTTGYQPSTITNSIDIDTGSAFSVLKDLRDKMGYDIWCEHEGSGSNEHIILKVGFAGTREQGTSTDEITLGENMQSLVIERAPVGDGRITRVIPLGGVGANGLRLTIADVNNHQRWLPTNPSALEAKYGAIEKVVIYDDLVDDGNKTASEVTAIKNELMRRGLEQLSLLTTGITGLKCRAVDLFTLSYTSTHPIRLGASYTFDCSFLGLAGTVADVFRLTEKVTDLSKPYDPDLTFSLPTASYKSQAANERIRVAQKIYALERSQAKRLDNTSIKKTTTSAYDPTAYNQNTIYLVDNGDDTGEIMLNGTSYGGGGSTTTVGNAAVMSTDFSDFNVTEQLMLDITPNTTLYYGASPSFMVIQGHYCLLCSISNIVQYINGVWTIGQTPGLYERIIANKAKFGSQIGNASGGGWLSGYSTGVAYPSRYIYEALEIYQISTTTAGKTYTAYLRLYGANTTAPSGDWWESTMSWGSFTKQQYSISLKAANNTDYMTTLNDAFIVPVLSQFTNDATIGTLKTPYGYANVAGYLIFSSADGAHYGVYWYPLSSGDTAITRAPCVSEAEQCFALGISKRTEPVTGGGT